MLHSSCARLAALVAIVASLFLPTFAQAGQCLADLREIALAGDTVRLRDFLCKASNDEPIVRVQFHRISDAALFDILNGPNSPSLAKIFGRLTIAQSKPRAVFDTLMEKFGELTTESCSRLNIETPSAGKGLADSSFCSEGAGKHTADNQPLKSLGGWNSWSAESIDFPAPDLLRGLPVGAQRWRSLSQADLSNRSALIAGLRAKIAKQYSADDAKIRAEVIKHVERRVALWSNLASAGLPVGFEIIIGQNLKGEECGTGGGRETFIIPRPLLAEVALIENITNHVIELTSYQGTASQSGGLRPAAVPQGNVEQLAIGKVHLAPGEKLLIIQKLTFAPSPALEEAIKEGSILKSTQKPEMINFDYGPALNLTRLQVGGEWLDLKERSANFISMTVASEEGSCPFVYAWNGRQRQWINYSKVLHRAQSRELEATDTKVFDGLRTKFRIIEKEAEVAHINAVMLELILEDGSRRYVHPKIEALVLKDDKYVTLFWDEETEIDFELPQSIRETSVRQSILHVTGYYERYDQLLSPTQQVYFTPREGHAPLARIATYNVCRPSGR